MEVIAGKGARMCKCREAAIRARRLAKIPPRFAGHYLTTLEPDTHAHPMQAEVVPMLKARPEGSYILAGRFGTGKTLMMWMLYRYAIKQTSRRVVVCTLSALLDEYRAFIQSSVNHETPRLPSVYAEQLRQIETPWSIFLDDIDKARPTEYAAGQFFELVNAVYEFGHQLVLTTNLTIPALGDHFDRADSRYGGAIVRRLADIATVVEMF